MRAQLVRAVPGVTALAATAEAIPLETASVDAVVAAQAFHWFDPERALPEIHRVLRPGGSLALVWNEWDTDGFAALARLQSLVESRRPATQTAWREQIFDDHPLFTPLEEHSFPNPFSQSREELVARVATTSFVAALPDDERATFLDEVRSLLADE